MDNGAGFRWDSGDTLLNRQVPFCALNRLTQKGVPERAGVDPIHTRDVYYGYDNRGLQLFARFDGATGQGVSSVYDGLGRLTASTIDLGGTVRSLGHAR